MPLVAHAFHGQFHGSDRGEKYGRRGWITLFEPRERTFGPVPPDILWSVRTTSKSSLGKKSDSLGGTRSLNADMGVSGERLLENPASALLSSSTT